MSRIRIAGKDLHDCRITLEDGTPIPRVMRVEIVMDWNTNEYMAVLHVFRPIVDLEDLEAKVEGKCGHPETSHTVDSTGEGWCNDCDNGGGAICHEFEGEP